MKLIEEGHVYIAAPLYLVKETEKYLEWRQRDQANERMGAGNSTL
jgi:DNA gyrase/topoisomerase IV subunit B